MTRMSMCAGRGFSFSVGRLLLGAPGLQRERATYSLIAVLVFVLFAGVQQFEVRYGLIDSGASNWLTAYNLAGALVFFVFVRSGQNLGFTADPSLCFAQCVFGVTSVCFSYAITGPARGGIMAILLLILVFSMFALEPVRIRQLSLCAVAMLISVMVWKNATDPLRYPIAVEVTHGLTGLVLICSMAVLSSRMGALRAALQQQKAQLEQALMRNVRLATLDELTGLFNRRHMGVWLQAEHMQTERLRPFMSIALIDIDLFKMVNDRYGHAAGDAVLREFARLVQKTLHARGTAARWGGEEFLLAMSGTMREDAVKLVDQLRMAFEALRFPHYDSALKITFSAGVATQVEGETIDSLMERADRCMYAAKAAGRNRVCAAEPLDMNVGLR
ncbi:diguanylate cyclase (GGDEF)-like protein [Variovorax sp. GrIS 2.14]